METADYMQVKIRTGLMKDYFSPESLDRHKEEDPSQYANVVAFIENEERLLTEGRKGEYALCYQGKLWGVNKEKSALLSDFWQKEGRHGCICDIIGGEQQ